MRVCVCVCHWKERAQITKEGCEFPASLGRKCVCVYIDISALLCVSVCVRVCVCVCTKKYMCSTLCVCVCNGCDKRICWHMCKCEWLCVVECVCVCVQRNICALLCVCVCVVVVIRGYVDTCVNVSGYVC